MIEDRKAMANCNRKNEAFKEVAEIASKHKKMGKMQY